VKHVSGADGKDILIVFEITADLIDNGKKVPIKLHTRIDGARKVTVE
jgi:hypothetical protein